MDGKSVKMIQMQAELRTKESGMSHATTEHDSSDVRGEAVLQDSDATAKDRVV